MGAVPRSALQLTAEEMREAGYRTVDMLVRHLTDEEAPPIRRATVGAMQELLGRAAAEEPTPFAEVLAGLEGDVLPYRARGDHPGFFAFISYCGTWPGALGDFIASAANVYASSWMESAGPSQVELEVLGWFKEWIGYPASATGILVSGGSAANMTALACAREALVGPMSDDLVAYVPDQAHSSLARAARVLGFRPDQVRVLPVGQGFRLDPATLQRAITADRTAGRRPLFVSVSGGSTNTGSVDPLAEIAAVCREEGVWLHVDAAYGAFAALTERGREALVGLELADSVTLDPHKWLYQAYECGCVLVRNGTLLRRAFEITPDYLLDAVPGEEEVNFSDLGMQLSRTSHAIKVWTSIRTFGVAAFRDAIDRSIDQALLAQRLIEESVTLEITSPAQLGVVCFSRRFEEAEGEHESDAMHEELIAALERSGIAFISSTRLRGRFSMRMCIMNFTTRDEDVAATIDFLANEPVARHPSPPPAVFEPHVALERGWLGRPRVSADELRLLPLFSDLDDQQVGRVLAASSERTCVKGDAIVVEGDGSRELYIVLEGEAAITRGGEPVATLGAGEPIGEIAALEWGAGFGYARTASATAASAVRALVIPAGRVDELVREIPALGERLRAIARSRLHRP
ncbi:MAG: aminotransferase class V-fold PLP-dependent enzyme [Thermoleophilia bacterium]|nr:aminotransferase class V-fold PLP-dependent enzyme [Thermoleophilia bacterium]